MTKSGRFSLSYERRLHYRWEFRRFFGQSEVFRLSECIVFRIPNDGGTSRLGITMKARGSSIERNHVKRQVREAWRNLSDILGSFDYNVVIPASKKLSYPYPQRLGLCLSKELPVAIARIQSKSQ